MATYKVIQDIEAEDKFLGPLTLKQFIFAAITVVSLYLSFIFLTKGIWVLVFPLVPVILVCSFLAFPWGRDQPTEIWLLAKIRFMFKPRRRIWDQTGMQELVKITAPKKSADTMQGDGLSQTEVKSRLRALADTIDSRGWAVKNADFETGTPGAASDRLVDASSLPQVSSKIIDPGVTEDMFDSPLASQLASQIAERDQSRRTNVVENMQQVLTTGQPATAAGPPANFWFMNQPAPANSGSATFGIQTALPDADDYADLPAHMKKPVPNEVEDEQLLSQIHSKKDMARKSFRNHKSVAPTSAERQHGNQASPVTGAPDPVTIELARNNDRSVESLARETNRLHPQDDDDEVVISLH